jgi:hypothetical protein
VFVGECRRLRQLRSVSVYERRGLWLWLWLWRRPWRWPPPSKGGSSVIDYAGWSCQVRAPQNGQHCRRPLALDRRGCVCRTCKNNTMSKSAPVESVYDVATRAMLAVVVARAVARASRRWWKWVRVQTRVRSSLDGRDSALERCRHWLQRKRAFRLWMRWMELLIGRCDVSDGQSAPRPSAARQYLYRNLSASSELQRARTARPTD